MLAILLHVTGGLAWLRRRRTARGEIPVLGFHRVVGAVTEPLPLALPEAMFEAIVRGAAQHYAMPLWERCVGALQEGLSKPLLVFTFDDGYRDQAAIAWPRLRAVGATGIFCVTTGVVDGHERFWWEVIGARHRPSPDVGVEIDDRGEASYGRAANAAIARLKSVPAEQWREQVRQAHAELYAAEVSCLTPAMSWEDVKRLAAAGAQFGGHGVTHPNLTQCGDAALAAELEGCRDALATHLRHGVSLFAYPNGSYDARVVAATQGAGFRWAFTVERGYFTADCDPLRIPRLMVSRAMCSWNGTRFSWPLFEAEVLGIFETLLGRRRRQRKTAAS
jgi:peptidoglycan/xylan/chitin deacetylase (PgdA/CDA1 family)